MQRWILAALPIAAALTAAPARAQSAATAAGRQVFAAESSFAASFARRDTAAFAALVAPDAVFFGEKAVMRGSAEVVAGWRPLLSDPVAPFSWRPEVVEVTASGDLAFSSGPVYGTDGRCIGRFNSIWRREPGGSWLVVFDKGSPACDCGATP